MRDVDIRRAVHQKVMRRHQFDTETLVLDELGLLNGDTRVDIAVINGQIHGYELKSERDTLERLPHQVELFSSVLDKVTLVVGETHLTDARHMVPTWWGVLVASSGPRGGIHIAQERRAKRNPQINLEAVAALLWRQEALELLEEYNAARGVRSKPRTILYHRLAERVPEPALRDAVRTRLKHRHAQGVWRQG